MNVLQHGFWEHAVLLALVNVSRIGVGTPLAAFPLLKIIGTPQRIQRLLPLIIVPNRLLDDNL